MRLLQKIKKNKEVFLLFFLYLVLRVPFLTKLPIFTDEAIYLDWGWRETQAGGNLYYSFYDGKQPLLMWIFGISERLLPDPLFAGRIVSVAAGILTMLGVYLIVKKLLNQKAAIAASVLYIAIPIFTFYDRQALMEASIAATGVWSAYFLTNLIKSGKNRYAVFLGIILGLGFFIKSSALIFIAASFLLLFANFIKSKNKSLLKSASIAIGMIFLTDILIFINPYFWATLSKTSRYSLGLSEVLSFPLSLWGQNISINSKILFFFLTPPVLAASAYGIFLIFKKHNKPLIILSVFFLLSLLFQVIFVRNPGQRYLVEFLPLALVFSIIPIYKLSKPKFNIAFALILILPLLMSLFLIFSPEKYLSTMLSITDVTEGEYVTNPGATVVPIVNYFKTMDQHEKIFVGVALNSGNPESGLIVYSQKMDNLTVGYMDSTMLRLPEDTKCVKAANGIKMYFVSRLNQQAGLERYLTRVNEIKNPYYSKYYSGIYTLNPNCSGKAFTIAPVMQD
jgi:4-amino-4-deoxy-L-arabinose transferase-like glycosyltransferase